MKIGDVNLPTEWLEEIVNLVAERIVVVNTKGIILYIDKAYCDFLSTTMERAIGKHITEVIEHTRMHIVANTGKAELAAIQPIMGSEMIANRYPLYAKGKLVGAVGTVMYQNPEEWREYSNKMQALVQELNFYKIKYHSAMTSKYVFDDLIGDSLEFSSIKKLAERIASGDSAVLLSGESGTGKELFAHAIHHGSPRAGSPFVRINCASIPEHLLESELFGYDEGAFTGAKKGGRKGKFELAEGGTIFLDEVGDMPLSMQSKLLRVLQEKEVERVGGQKTIVVNVRVIAATHRDLEAMVKEGAFRHDLYYRLNVINLEIPPLRKRREDIPFIAEALLKKLEYKFHRKDIEISPTVMEKLKHHKWPGNIRGVENVLERAINVLDGQRIDIPHLPLYLRDDELYSGAGFEIPIHAFIGGAKTEDCPVKLSDMLAMAEKYAIANAIQRAGGNKQKAAVILGISKTSLYDKCKKHEIN
ncbi:sigma-54 interaction domain-containing protein [Heyndrickxia acidicola]|uniref:Sigma 54-interacting transcriptional regulator n=1 Tax=Heyndrickxia acidicola TaxID=209389 RepID=A0ABU6MNJ3_9BACI|nr:sigma 54-interacting transcriptional regulator [Heyndrickxia acidicola]MED1206075.1 sigma 54-interacting transcriptional regulator [Heyndrickxia acidicola]